MPKTLLELLEQNIGVDESPTLLPLGVRFLLAQKLVQSLYVMHTTGWVHKK